MDTALPPPYLRVSTRSQDLANQKLAILEFSRKRQFPIDQFIESRISSRKEFIETLPTVPLQIIDDLGMRKLPPRAAEELLEIVMRRYERTNTLLTSNRPVEDWGNTG